MEFGTEAEFKRIRDFIVSRLSIAVANEESKSRLTKITSVELAEYITKLAAQQDSFVKLSFNI